MFDRCIIVVADGARADVMRELLFSGRLPNIKKHLVDRGCFRTALSVFPSTTGPAHIPFVCGLHPGTANVPGYRWLCRKTHDEKRWSFRRHRSLNSPLGLFMGRDMHPEKSTSLFEHFDRPSSILEPVDLCRNRPLYKLIFRRLYHVVRAHQTDDWNPVDRMVEKKVIQRIHAGSECVVAQFYSIDEYSHLYSPFHEKTIGAYRSIDAAVGQITAVLQELGIYQKTVLAVVSDHGLTPTDVHIPLVDLLKDEGFNPFRYPKRYRKNHDSAVMESGNAMAQLYFKRGRQWGKHWHYQEMAGDRRAGKLLNRLIHTQGVSFAAARCDGDGVIIAGRGGELTAERNNGGFHIAVKGQSPLEKHPVGPVSGRELFHATYDSCYPDAVNQLYKLFASPRSGDLIVSSDPGYDLRYQFESPEHKSSHGSLHREHMQVPLAFSVPFANERLYNYDLVPTILALTGKRSSVPLDGEPLDVTGVALPLTPPALAPAPVYPGAEENQKYLSLAVTLGIIVTGIILVGMFQSDVHRFGLEIMRRYGQAQVDMVLFLLCAISSTLLPLPIWGYAVAGVAMGYNVIHLAIVMALGSALGSFVTFLMGRYLGRTQFVKKKFPNLEKHPWTAGKSKKMVTLFLFLGTASPIPCDVFYVACGFKRYPPVLFYMTAAGARFVRYCYLGYGFKYFLT